MTQQDVFGQIKALNYQIEDQDAINFSENFLSLVNVNL